MQEKDREENKFEKKISLGKMCEKEEKEFMKLLYKYEEIFEYDKEKLGRVEGVKHKIRLLENQKPIKRTRYKETPDKAKIIRAEVDKLLELRKIRKSESPRAFPVTLAAKKGGKKRFCID